MAPNIQILGSKKHIFAPSGQLEPHRSMFSTQKRCLIGIPIRGYQNFYSLPPKNWILGPKTAKFGPKRHFGPNIGIFGPFDLMPDQKQCGQVAEVVFCYVGTKLLLNPIKIRIIGPKNGQIWSKICIFWSFLGQILPFFCTFCPIPDQKTM